MNTNKAEKDDQLTENAPKSDSSWISDIIKQIL